jgi:hypothetical protein
MNQCKKTTESTHNKQGKPDIKPAQCKPDRYPLDQWAPYINRDACLFSNNCSGRGIDRGSNGSTGRKPPLVLHPSLSTLLCLLSLLRVIICLYPLGLLPGRGLASFLGCLNLPYLCLLGCLPRFLGLPGQISTLYPGLIGADLIGPLYFPCLLHLLKLGLYRSLGSIPGLLCFLTGLQVIIRTLGLLGFLNPLGLGNLLRLTRLLRRTLLQFLQHLT